VPAAQLEEGDEYRSSMGSNVLFKPLHKREAIEQSGAQRTRI
jgi:hypothetical protein